MAQNITLMGASYSDVPSVLLPKTGGGQASFTDVTDTTAAASDVAQGKYFYTAAGVKTEGTSTGGIEDGHVYQDANGYVVLDDDSGKVYQTVSKSYTPTESQQTESITPGTGYDALAQVDVTVGAISSSYVGSGITRCDSTDLTASGATVSVPAGYYENAASKAVTSGSATPAASISAAGATVTTGTNTLTFSKSVSNSPQVSAGYISAGSSGNTSVSLTASIDTRSSSDLTASNLTVTAPSGYYASNATKTLSDEYLLAENIKKNITIFGVTGSFEGGGGGLVYETGTWTPAEDTTDYDISFTNTHTTAPFYYMISNASGEYSNVTNSSFGVFYFNYHQLFGQKWDASTTSARYGQVLSFYRGTSTTNLTNTVANLTLPYTDTSTSSNAPRYYANESRIRAKTSATAYFRTGVPYKWIAVWVPTS